jgi:hypothetical protein
MKRAFTTGAAREVADQLRPHAERLCLELFRNGKRHGNEVRVASLDDDQRGESAAIYIAGPQMGRGQDYAGGPSHDPIGWLKKRLNLTTSQAVLFGKQYLGEAPPVAYEPPPKRDTNAAARQIYRIARDVRGTIGETYLRETRKITLIPDDMKFLSHCRYVVPGDSKPELLGQFPAIIVPLRRFDTGELIAVQRIYLQPDGSDKLWINGQRCKPKTLGLIGGAAAILTPYAAGDEIALGEGVETCLSAAMLMKERRSVWCSCGVGNSRRVVIPPATPRIILLVDNDADGRKGALEAAAAFEDQDFRVIRKSPPRGKDFNDYIKGD